MKNLCKNSMLLFLAGVLAVSCTKRVNIPLKQGNVKLVVEGYLFGKDSVSWVRLTKTSGYFSNEPPPVVSHARVIVSHKSRQWTLKESVHHPGTYFLRDTSFHLIVSDTFRLDIQLQNPIGNYKNYESQTVVPPLRIHIDSLSIQYATGFKKWMVRYYGQDSIGPDFYLFNSKVNGHIVTDSIMQKTVREDVYFDGRYVSGALVQVLNDNVLKIGDEYTLMASNITKGYYHYMIALQDEVGDKNPWFSGPPANVSSDINHGAVGFFTAFLTTSYRVQLESISKNVVLKIRPKQKTVKN